MDKYKMLCDEKSNELKQLESEMKRLYIKTESNKKVLKNVKSGKDELKSVIHEYENLDILLRTASGELKGSSKLAFEQYIQSAYFERIITEANKRLIKKFHNSFL